MTFPARSNLDGVNRGDWNGTIGRLGNWELGNWEIGKLERWRKVNPPAGRVKAARTTPSPDLRGAFSLQGGLGVFSHFLHTRSVQSARLVHVRPPSCPEREDRCRPRWRRKGSVHATIRFGRRGRDRDRSSGRLSAAPGGDLETPRGPREAARGVHLLSGGVVRRYALAFAIISGGHETPPGRPVLRRAAARPAWLLAPARGSERRRRFVPEVHREGPVRAGRARSSGLP